VSRNYKSYLLLFISLGTIAALATGFFAREKNALQSVSGKLDLSSPLSAEGVGLNLGLATLAKDANNAYLSSGTLTLSPYSVNTDLTNWQMVLVSAKIYHWTDSIKAEYRVANDLTQLDAAYWTQSRIHWTLSNVDSGVIKYDTIYVGTIALSKEGRYIQFRFNLATQDTAKSPVLSDVSVYHQIKTKADDPSEMVVGCSGANSFLLKNDWQEFDTRTPQPGKNPKVHLSPFEIHLIFDVNEYKRFVQSFLKNTEALTNFQKKFPHYLPKKQQSRLYVEDNVVTWEENFAYCQWRGPDLYPISTAQAEYYRQMVAAKNTKACQPKNSSQDELPIWLDKTFLADGYRIVTHRKAANGVYGDFTIIPMLTSKEGLGSVANPIALMEKGGFRAMQFRTKTENSMVGGDFQADVPNSIKDLNRHPIVCVKTESGCKDCKPKVDLEDFYK
jgi:hypothetical protein